MLFQLTIFLAVAGSFQAPWRSLGACGEQYCLKWESRYLLDLGSVLDTLWDGLVSVVAQEALKYTVLSGELFIYVIELGAILTLFECI